MIKIAFFEKERRKQRTKGCQSFRLPYFDRQEYGEGLLDGLGIVSKKKVFFGRLYDLL
ncbi:hypothetical protein [Sphingobacterium lumbrici]|uniref:hypothetical protein n=1 Tax=Sphingobacterium lumbrici TaxID=2559600 RepID=UPI001C106E3C|nr:hypothetical protein [Sphingobacterium lumbrici]